MKRIYYTRSDGGVAVCSPSPGGRLVRGMGLNGGDTTEFVISLPLSNAFAAIGLGRGWSNEKLALVNVEYAESEDEFISRIQSKDVPSDAMNVAVVDDADRPANRVFRNAWRQTGALAPHVDMPLARAIKTDLIREERAKVLPPNGMGALDVKLRDAMADGNTAEITRLRAAIQQWRDLPAATQDDLTDMTNPSSLEKWQPVWPPES